jgi:hypothetical protein
LEENALAKLAAQQRDVVSIEKLHAGGFDNSAIRRRCHAAHCSDCTEAGIWSAMPPRPTILHRRDAIASPPQC